MIVDTSAVIALIAGERSAPAIQRALRSGQRSRMAVATLTETLIVAENKFETSLRADAEAILAAAQVEFVGMTDEDARSAADAYARFGKGNHPARLNLGDCFAYALAKRTGEPLLCVGDDFARTDIALVPLEAA